MQLSADTVKEYGARYNKIASQLPPAFLHDGTGIRAPIPPSRSNVLPVLLDRLYVTGLPALVEPGLQRAIEPQGDVVASARHGLDPVLLMALWRLRSEPDGDAAIGVHCDARNRAVDAGELLVGRQERAGLVVIDGEGPEAIGRDRLLDEVWGWSYAVSTRAVDIRIAEIRKALEDNADAPRYIETVTGYGYRFKSPVQAP